MKIITLFFVCLLGFTSLTAAAQNNCNCVTANNSSQSTGNSNTTTVPRVQGTGRTNPARQQPQTSRNGGATQRVVVAIPQILQNSIKEMEKDLEEVRVDSDAIREHSEAAAKNSQQANEKLAEIAPGVEEIRVDADAIRENTERIANNSGYPWWLPLALGIIIALLAVIAAVAFWRGGQIHAGLAAVTGLLHSEDKQNPGLIQRLDAEFGQQHQFRTRTTQHFSAVESHQDREVQHMDQVKRTMSWFQRTYGNGQQEEPTPPPQGEEENNNNNGQNNN